MARAEAAAAESQARMEAQEKVCAQIVRSLKIVGLECSAILELI